jgi:phosphate transport system permease protein
LRRVFTTREVNRGDQVFRLVASVFAVLVLVVLVAIAVEMTRASEKSLLHFGWRFIIGTAWNPVKQDFGALPFIFGTVVSSLLALLMAVPVGFGTAIFLADFSPGRWRAPLSFLVELLAAVPSVVYGLWGIFVLAPLLRETVQPALQSTLGFLPFFEGPMMGYGMLAGSIILAIMILPTIASVSREVLRAVPNNLREAALALGATPSEAVLKVVVPTAKSGLFGAVMLGLGRALGETMAITMLIGNRPEIHASLFSPAYSMASVIANEFTEATEALHLAALAEIGLLLFVVTVLLNIGARLLIGQVRRSA